ncbi:MAG: triacylglycerol lipase [Actinobacteria bacterium]|nr:triacylglycerol lipase [Actinomycetota bacterium]
MTRLRRPASRLICSLAAAAAIALPLTTLAAAPAGAARTAAATPAARASAASCDTAPAGDGFYDPPSPLPAGTHGDIVWCRPASSPVSGSQAWQILYLSTTAGGQPTAISGTVFVPAAPYVGTRPVVAYAPGTQGWGDQCAPSREIAAGDFDEQFAVSNLLAKGWAVVVTDYPGLGTPGVEAYNVGIPEGYGVLDSLRAATLLPGTGLSQSAPMGIEGYSQGGGAADWAAQLQPSYAPGLDLTGVAAGGTPANLQAVASNINGSVWFAFLAGTAEGFSTVYPSLDLNRQLTPAGQAAMAQLETMCQAQGLLTFAGKKIEDYTVGGINPITEPQWQSVLDTNDLGAMKPAVPLYQYHGLLDEIIPYRVEQTLHQQYCAQGVTTRLTGYLGDHILTQVLAQADVVSWLGARLAGTPATGNC